jgi:hypothetical protein
MYLIKWKGYGKRHNSWEPETNLNGELLQSFEAARDSHTALLVAAALEPGFFSDLHFEGVEDVLHDTLCRAYAASLHKQTEAVVHDSRKAVEHLMSKQKVGGTVDDWLPGYEAELEKVKRLRLRELEPEEAVRVRKDQLVPRLRMILEAKRDGRRKGRLILQGFLEPYSWDSGVSNDSPVVGMATIRCLLASMRVADVVSARDVSVAFLQSHGYNPDEPKRYVSYTAYKGAVEQVFQLLGPLYGQRSASRRWYETIVGWLTAPPSKGGAGFEQGKNEPCLFRDPVTGLRVVLYVDDLLVVGDAKASRDFHEALGERFSCRDPAEYLAVDNDLEFLGFTITEERVDEVRSVYMDQEDAVGDFLSEFKHQALQLKQSPMPTKTLFHSDPTPLSENAAAVYRHAVGTLNYFARTTRFDIAYAVSRLSSKMSQPDMGAHKSLVHLLGYLLATRQFRIGGELKDTCGYMYYCDSDHAGDKGTNARSQTGFVAFLNSFPVDWCSRKQPDTAVSPAQAEIYAMQEAVQAFKLLQWVCEEMGLKPQWPLDIHTDSSQARSFQHNTCPATKLRGMIDIRNQAVQEMREKGVISTTLIPRNINVADMFTHCLSRRGFSTHLQRAQNLQCHNSRAGCELTLVYYCRIVS